MTNLSDQALLILHEWVQSESLRRHCYAVSDCMRHFALSSGADADLWQAVGLLHDMDYERYPNTEHDPTEERGKVAARVCLERRDLPRDFIARELYRRHPRDFPGEDALCGG